MRQNRSVKPGREDAMTADAAALAPQPRRDPRGHCAASVSSPPTAPRSTSTEIATWDRYLLREHRLLVPIDVQALYVPPGDTEPMVRLPMLVAGPTARASVTDPEDGLPDPFDEGAPRPAGVHLHWAMPDALLRGTLRPSAPTAPRTGSRCRCCRTAGSCCASCCRKGAADAGRHRLGDRGRSRRGGAARAVDRGRRGASRRRTPRPARRSAQGRSPAPSAAR